MGGVATAAGDARWRVGGFVEKRDDLARDLFGRTPIDDRELPLLGGFGKVEAEGYDVVAFPGERRAVRTPLPVQRPNAAAQMDRGPSSASTHATAPSAIVVKTSSDRRSWSADPVERQKAASRGIAVRGGSRVPDTRECVRRCPG